MLRTLRDRLTRIFALRFREYSRARARSSPDDVLRAARATMKRKTFCVLATQGEHGVAARVLQPFPPEEDLVVWLGTSRSSRKVAELERDPRATLVYEDDDKGACVVLAGTITVVDTLAEREARFHATWFAFWPEGPRSDDYVLLRFEPSRIEVWDAARRITPEPFGLASMHLVKRGDGWAAADAARSSTRTVAHE